MSETFPNRHAGLRSDAHAKPIGWWPLIVPVLAVLLGASAMKKHGLEIRIWGLNIAVLLGAIAACIAIKVSSPRFSRWKWVGGCIFCLSILALVSTFCFPSLQGVHRWLLIGSLRFHAAAMFLPTVLIVLSLICNRPGALLAIVLALLVAVLLAIQPDAAQETAFAIAAGFLLISRGLSRERTLFVIGGLLMCVIVVWLRPDPLPAVEYVEGIVGLAWKLRPWLAAACVGALALLPLPFVWFWWQNKGTREANLALALAIYFAMTLLAPLVGNFPVPIMGYGASPIIGYFIAVGWLLIQGRKGKESANIESGFEHPQECRR